MKATLQVLPILSVFLLASCGGSGGGGGSTTPPPSPPPESDSPGGIWLGTLTSSVLNQVEEIVGVITETGQARFVSLDGGQQFFGQISMDGDTASGTLRAVSLVGGEFADGSSSGNINIEATVSERNTIEGTFVGVGDEGTFSVAFDTLYDLDSSLLAVQGHWTAPESIFKILVPGFGSAPLGARVDAFGGIDAADLDGCDYSGSVGILDAQFNVYSVTLVVSSCAAWDGQYSGFGVFDNSTEPTDALLIAVATNEVSIVGLLAEAAAESASGLWSGTIQSTLTGNHETLGMISEEGDAQFFSLTGSQITGSVEVFGNIVRMSTTAYAPFGTTHPDGSVSGSVDVRGLVTTAFRSSGTFVGVGDSGIYDIFYSTDYERTSSLSRVQGLWSTPSPTGGSGDLIISVASTGEFSGSSDGCSYSGLIGLIDSTFNLYRVDADIANCAGITGQYSGLGTLSDEQSPNDTLVVSVNNEVTSLWALFSRVP
ncbi:MAG TPA: hypothetical protein VLA11_00025 [Woeseiaceae bacterium]|nr:hypothetical protein [Woeseiaceae bacterium]